MEGNIRQLFNTTGKIGASEGRIEFLKELTEIVNVLCNEAQRQGFKIGLGKPDKRHM